MNHLDIMVSLRPDGFSGYTQVIFCYGCSRKILDPWEAEELGKKLLSAAKLGLSIEKILQSSQPKRTTP